MNKNTVNKGNKKYIIVYLVLLGVFMLGIIYAVMPVSLPEAAGGIFNETRLLLTYHTPGTAPALKVMKGNQSIKHLYTENNDYIKIAGEMPSQSLSWEACTNSDFIVYGRIIGTTDEFMITGHGIIPLFYVEAWRPTRYLMNLFYGKGQTSYLKIFLLYSLYFIVWHVFWGIILFIQWAGRCKQPNPGESGGDKITIIYGHFDGKLLHHREMANPLSRTGAPGRAHKNPR